MGYKRNKLLIFLGLITIAVSKSHNQRFDLMRQHEFEPVRRSASHSISANTRLADATHFAKSSQPYDASNSFSEFVLHDNSDRKVDRLMRRVFEEEYDDLWPKMSEMAPSRDVQFSRRQGSVHEESTDQSKIDPQDFYFEPQKVKGNTNPSNKRKTAATLDGRSLSRRTGILIADTSKSDTGSKTETTTIKIEAKKEATQPAKDTTHKEQKTDDSEKQGDKKDAVVKKRKLKRKKVVRVRPRTQNSNNKTLANSGKKIVSGEKVKMITVSADKKQKHPTVIKTPKKDSSIEAQTTTRSPEIPVQREVFQSNKTTSLKKRKVIPKNDTKSNDPEKKVAFFRRSGPKTGLPEQEQLKTEWISEYENEDKDSDDNYYVLSFNYMGNKDDPAKDIQRLPQTANVRKVTKSDHDLQSKISSSGRTGERPTAELNISHLEEVADKFLERQKSLVQNNAAHQNGYYRQKQNVPSVNDDDEYYDKTYDTPGLVADDERYLEKQYSPKVILKTKKDKKHNGPTWKLQSHKKRLPKEERKTHKPNGNFENHSNSRNRVENNEHRPNSGGSGYHVRSFIKLPSGDNVDIDFKQPFPTGEFRSIPRKPFRPLENKRDGNFFMHMYKQMGNIENFDVKHGEPPRNGGYLSSLKLTWTDDDTRARVEEALDSRAFLPRQPSYSRESFGSIEDSSKETFEPQPSENVMRFISNDANHFTSPSTGNKPFYFQDIPFVHRSKRSADNVLKVTSHFRMGNSKVENNYTLDYKPNERFFSKRTRLPVNNAAAQKQPKAPTNAQSGNTKRQSNVENHFSLNNQPSDRLFSKRTGLLVNNRAIQEQTKASENQSGNTNVQSNTENRYSLNYKPTARLFSKRKGNNSEVQEQPKAMTKTQSENTQSNLGSNYTLNYHPRVRLFSKRTGLIINNAAEEQAKASMNTQSGNVNVQPIIATNKQGNQNVKSYFLKPMESRGIQQLKSAFNITDIFDKYEKPSREMMNIQIFQTYQTPNRSPQQAHDLTYFHNDKNTQMKIKITDKVRTSRMDTAEPNLSSTDVKTSTSQNNFKTMAKSAVVQSSTEIKESYLKPEKETASKVLKQRTSEENQEETTQNTPTIEARNDRPTTKSLGITEDRSTSKATTSYYDVGSIVPTTERGDRENVKSTSKSILTDRETTKITIDEDVKDTTKFAVTKPYRATARPVIYKSNRTTKASTVRKTKPATKSATFKSDRTTKNATITGTDRTKKYTATRKIKTAKNITARNDQLTSRPAVVRKRKTTAKPTTLRNYQTIAKPATVTNDQTTAKPTTVRNYQTTAKPTTVRNYQTTARSITAALSNYHATTKSSSASVKNDQTTSRPTTARNDQTTRPTTARNDQTRKLTPTRNEQTTTKSYFDISTTKKPAIKTIKLETVGNARFFRKAGDIKDRGTQASSTVEARRIDDKTWLYPQEQRDDESEELYDVEPELPKDNYRKQQIHQHKDIPLPLENEFQKSTNEIKPQIPFEWHNSVTSLYAHEINYPTYHSIPKTRFTCKGRIPGYYADPETSCQVFHMCHGNGVKHSFLCPNTTIFNQRLLVCDYYSKVHCENVESYYEVSNSLLYKHAPRKTNDYELQQKRNWNSQQNQNPITTKYASHTNRNHHQNNQQLTHNAVRNKEVNDMPQFIVKHFKENIPHAEFGRPKGVSKSYSAVISEPNTQQNQLPNNGHYLNERPLIQIKSPNTEEKLIPDTFAEKYRAIKNSWNGREIQKTLNNELLRVPELRAHGNSFQRNLNAPEKSKVIIPLIKKDNSYYVPNLGDEFGYLKNDDVHIAGRQNEKVIIVNRNRLKADYDSSESEESDESDKTSLHGALENTAQNVANRAPYNTDLGKELLDHEITIKNLPNGDAYKRNKNGAKLQAPKDTYRSNDATRDQKQSYPKTTQYKQQYPLQGAEQNRGVSRDFNYEYRTEDPKVTELIKTQKQNEPRYNHDVPIKNDAEEKSYIKTRIAEIKKGVDNIGAQVSGILGGNDNTFKNVRIFKLRPDGLGGELEEIRLSPFKFERQSQHPKAKLKEKKREDISIEVVKKDPRTHSYIREFNTYMQPESINSEKKPKTHSTFHANSNSKNGEDIDFLAVPKLLQNVAKEIAPRYKDLSTFKPSKANYEKNERLIQVVPNNARPRTTNTDNDVNLRNSHENVNTNPTDSLFQKNLPPRETLVNINIESRIPTASNFKEPTIPFTNTGEMFKTGLDAKDFPTKYKNENSERFENMHVPKKNHGSDNFDSLNPIKTKLLRQKQLVKTQKANIEKFTAADGRENSNYNVYNKEFNADANVYKLTNNNFNGKIPETKFLPVQHTNEQEMHHQKAMPHNDKRTFLVFSKPVTTTERHFNIPRPTVNTYPFNNYQTNRVRIQPTLNQDPSNECDDSTSNLNTFNALELGKNGPQKQHLSAERGAGNSKIYYNAQDKGASKCRENSASKGQNFKQDFNKSPESVEMPNKNPNLYITQTPNAASKDLKQPAYIFAPPQTSARFNTKIPGEAIQFKNKPVNLFDVPRNSRPAFTKPITAIVPAMPEARHNYYHQPQTVKDTRPIRNYQNQRTVRPLVNYQNPRRVVRPTAQYQHVRGTRPASHSQDDSRSIERSKRVTHGNNSKYAAYEKAAEKKVPAYEPKPPKIFSPARPNPQGKIVKTQKEQSDESDDSSNQKRPSRYAALEKAAELKAERMIKSKSQNKPKS